MFEEVRRGEVGLLLVCGNALMTCYLGDKHATNGALRELRVRSAVAR